MIRSPAGFDGGDRIKRYLDYYQPSYGVMMLSAGQFSPALLFAAGEQGAWYDPSDFSTMFQDSTGTTPVTAVEQPVGLILDKSKGLTGTQQVADPSFDSGISGWGAQFPGSSVTYAWNSGLKSLTVTRGAGDNTGRPTYPVSIVSGTWYKISLTTNAAGVTNSAAFSVVNSSGSASIFSGSALGPQAIGATSKTIYALATSTTTAYIGFWCANSTSADILSVEFTAVAGNHASQSTAASRPVLSARVNLLTYSEQFDNAAWTKAAVTVTANATTAPDGTSTANLMVATAVDARHAVSQSSIGSSQASICAKAAGYNYAVLEWIGAAQYVIFNLTTGAVASASANASGTMTSLGNGWYRCTGTTTSTGYTNCSFGVFNAATIGTFTFTGDGTSGIYLWGADLRVTNVGVGLPAYQRVAAATDYDTSGFPLYLKFDGTDDSLATGTIDPGSVDKAQVFAGVRKLSDVAQAFLVEYSVNINSNNGSFALQTPNNPSATYYWTSKGTVRADPYTLLFPAPTTNVVTGLGDISGDLSTLRVNGVQQAQVAADQGTGNFLSYSLYIGLRGGSTNPLNGQVYSLIVRFSAANLSDAQIASTETYVNNLTKAY